MHTTLLRRAPWGLAVIGVCGTALGQSIAPGGTVVGVSYNGGLYTPFPTRWASVGSDAELLGVSAVGGGGEPYRCSDDGRTVVGRWLPDQNTSTPVMWGPTGVYTALAGPGSVSEANGVSADGTYITGWSAPSNRYLLRWTNGTLTQQYGPSFLSGPCSPDGSMAIGTSYLGGNAAALAGPRSGLLFPAGSFSRTG